jgi:hypothetical protein
VSLPCASFFCPRFPLDHPPRTPYRFKARMKFAGVAPTALGLASELFPAFARWANFCRASGVDLREAVRFTPANLQLTLALRNEGSSEVRHLPPAHDGPRHSGRSMLRPYGILLRQGASGSRKREQAPALHFTPANMQLTLALRNEGSSEVRHSPPAHDGPRHSGRSMLRPYRTLLRQGAPGSRKREQAPALHRSAARLRLECGGSPPLSRTSAYGTLAATEPFEDTS